MVSVIDEIVDKIERELVLYVNVEKPTLHIFYLSNDIPSLKYINNKIKKAKKFNITTILHQPATLEELTNEISSIPANDKIIIQYPIVTEVFGDIKDLYQKHISKEQDIDGFLFDFLDIHTCNTIEDFLNHKSFSPTAKGALQILKELNVKISGANVAVLGKGLTSGLPVANSIAKLGGNVTWLDKSCSSDRFGKVIYESDIIVSCTGAKNIINKYTHSLRKSVVYINIGMSSDDKGRIIGDINYSEVSNLENTFYVNDVLKTTGVLTTLNLIANCIPNVK